MVKQRMTALDVRASVEEMQAELQGLRLLNIYDISSKMFLFRFGHGDNKRTLLLESGVRMHLTHLVREKPKVPSQFTLKLRKHVRAWRLDSVTQLHHDRTVDFRFGAGETASYHIILELFSKGNIVLTDHEYRILLLLRTHRDNGINMSVREMYPLTTPLEEQQPQPREEMHLQSAEEQRAWCTEVLRRDWHAVFARHADYETTRSTLSAVQHFGPALADHILKVTGVKNTKKGDMTCDAEEMFTRLLPGMLEAWTIASSALPGGGYLISKSKQGKGCKGGRDASQEQHEGQPTGEGEAKTMNVAASGAPQLQVVHYDDFSPVLLAQYKDDAVETSFLPSFGGVCDAFFLYTETERIEQHNEKKATSVLSKKEKFERDHQRRLCILEREEQENQQKGECIIQNAEKIDEAIGLINGALAAGIQWDALRSLLKRRHAEGHPVAYMVHELFLERNSISVLLEENEHEGDEDCDVTPHVIEVDLGKTAYANAAMYFGKMKANRVKYEKTVASTAKAMAGAEKKGERLAAKQKKKKAILKERRRFWWEKFSWFRTSCGDYVLQGKDVATTEILVRRIMQLGDVFLQCDVDGAFPCVLRPLGSAWTTAPMQDSNNSPPQARTCALHMRSVEEAGAWCVSRSSAWESKFSVGAWWVHASQITGGTATGCYLFDGERHYVRPQPLSLACGLLFRVSSRTIDPTDREELPNFIAESDRHLMDENDDSNDCAFFPPDDATALHPLPAVEEVRGPRRRPPHEPPLPPQQQQKNQHNNSGKTQRAGAAPPAAKTAAAEVGGEANESAPALKSMQQLSKHQRRKLKKIQEKYKDQDEEDRLHGALLNGNQLSKVQKELLALQREREQHRETVLLRKSKRHGDDDSEESGTEGREEAERDVNVVSEFAHEDGAANNHSFSVSGGDLSVEREPEPEGQQQADPPHRRPRAAVASVEETRAANDAELRREWRHFTSRPQPTDNIEYAVAICAPMSSVVSYKYRAELSCGTAKKGQVATSLQTHFATLAAGGKNESEIHAVQSLEANDFMEQLRGNLKRFNTKQTK